MEQYFFTISKTHRDKNLDGCLGTFLSIRKGQAGMDLGYQDHSQGGGQSIDQFERSSDLLKCCSGVFS